MMRPFADKTKCFWRCRVGTEVSVSETEDAAVCSVDHRLDDLRQRPRTHLSLSGWRSTLNRPIRLQHSHITGQLQQLFLGRFTGVNVTQSTDWTQFTCCSWLTALGSSSYVTVRTLWYSKITNDRINLNIFIRICNNKETETQWTLQEPASLSPPVTRSDVSCCRLSLG